MKYHILMADAVSSRKQNPTVFIDVLQDVVKEVNKKWKHAILSPFKISLGDEFQGVTSSLVASSEIILFIEERLNQVDIDFKLRYVSHYGTIDSPVNNAKSLVMIGEGLTSAREAINALKKSDSRFFFSTEEKDQHVQTLLNYSFVWFQSLVDAWKFEDRAWLRLFLQNKDYKEIASIFEVPRSTAWRRKRSLKIEEYNTSKALINGLLL
jgi:hypothetical protein